MEVKEFQHFLRIQNKNREVQVVKRRQFMRKFYNKNRISVF